MKSPLYALLSAWLLLSLTACAAATEAPPVPSGPEVFGVFEGNTPCDPVSRPLPQIPEDSDCEQMIWKIVLYRDPDSGNPTTYELDTAYGVPKQGTPDLEGGGKKITMAGKWDILKGTAADPQAVVYRLNPDDPPAAVSFLKIHDDILHLLNPDGALKTGNASWSYTLNRTDNRARVDPGREAGEPPDSPTRPPIPPPPAGTNTLGIFEGRTPCHDIALEFMNVPAYPGCLKLKWRLSLYLDRKTGERGAYLLVGTRTINPGTWTIMRGTPQDPNAVIYRLTPDDSGQSVYFLKADDNHLFLLDQDMNPLVGNALFSYTLSRTEAAAQ